MSEPVTVWLTPDDVPELKAVHARAVAAMPDPTLVRPEDETSFATAFRNGEIVGIRIGGELAGYGLVRPAGALACDRLGLEEWMAAHDVLYVLDGSAVAPEFRGRDLHHRLVNVRLDHARAHGARHTSATAAPGNNASMRNLMRAGFRIVSHVTKSYGERYVLWRPVDAVSDAPEEGEWVPARDVARARALLADGRVAVAARRDEAGVPMLRFAMAEA